MSATSKTAIVTGGSRGLGRNMAVALADAGLNVVITYNTNEAAAEEVVAQIRKTGRKSFALPLDTSNVKQFDGFIKDVTNRLNGEMGSPRFDFLINNAGTALYAPAEETTEEQVDAIFNIHY